MWCHSLLVIAGAQEMLWGRGIFLLDRRATACNLHIESCFWVGPSRCQQPQHTSPKHPPEQVPPMSREDLWKSQSEKIRNLRPRADSCAVLYRGAVQESSRISASQGDEQGETGQLYRMTGS